MILQDWQKQVLKMTKGQKLAPIFKTTKNKDMKNLKSSKVKEEAKKFLDHEDDVIYITGNDHDGFWYAAKGVRTVNFTKSIKESNNINDWVDLDCFNWSEEINNLETFIEAVEY